MPSQSIEITDGGGIKLTVVDENGVERSVTFEPDDNGNIAIKGRGPNGEKKGLMDPSGNGSNPLGK